MKTVQRTPKRIGTEDVTSVLVVYGKPSELSFRRHPDADIKISSRLNLLWINLRPVVVEFQYPRRHYNRPEPRTRTV